MAFVPAMCVTRAILRAIPIVMFMKLSAPGPSSRRLSVSSVAGCGRAPRGGDERRIVARAQRVHRGSDRAGLAARPRLVTGYGGVRRAHPRETGSSSASAHSGSGAIIDLTATHHQRHVVAGARHVQVGSSRHHSGRSGALVGFCGQRSTPRRRHGERHRPRAPQSRVTGLRGLPFAITTPSVRGAGVRVRQPEACAIGDDGVVSSVARQPQPPARPSTFEPSADNPGNSGGRCQHRRRAGGLNTFILTESGGSQGWASRFRARRRRGVSQLRKYGHLHHGGLGFTIRRSPRRWRPACLART